jgi:hypothetical protein
MQTRRLGRKIKLLATMAIKHQIRMQMEVTKVGAAEAGAERFPGLSGPVLPGLFNALN